jgi:hypothetical protein
VIAKHIPMRAARRSSFQELVAYITHAKDKAVRVREVRVTNCHQQEARDAALEVLATQLQNKRACSDKTYHLLISFDAGDRPSPQARREIEDELCESLGFGKHQRVSAVHADTDNLHVHVAINKIHPKALTIHNPYRDYKALGAVCERLEQLHGLVHTNHETIAPGARSRAVDMEYLAGVESLLGWIRRECLEELRQAQSWAQLHDALGRNGLVLQERGNGLVVLDREGRAVKASSIARELSKAQLVKRLGQFQPEEKKQIQAVRSYQSRPILPQSRHAEELYQRYRTAQASLHRAQMQARHDLREQKHCLVSQAKDCAGMKRRLIRQLDCGRLTKRVLYHQVSVGLREDLQSIHEHARAQGMASLGNARPLSWFDWLAQQAAMNDAEALAALRRRQCRAARRANGLLGALQQGRGEAVTKGVEPEDGERSFPGLKVDGVTKQGTIIYAQGKSAIRDSGRRLEVSEGIDQKGIEIALAMASMRFGGHITIEGDAAFRNRVLNTAKALRLDIAFTGKTQQQAGSAPFQDKRKAQPPASTDAGSASVPADAGAAAARRYIAERELKRQKIATIPRHVLGERKPYEPIRYAGWRRVGGQFLLLARIRDDEIAVIPVDAAIIARISGVRRGEAIRLDGAPLHRSRGVAR